MPDRVLSLVIVLFDVFLLFSDVVFL